MNETLLALVAFSPIVVAAILLVGLNWPAKSQESHACGFRPYRCDCPDILGYVG